MTYLKLQVKYYCNFSWDKNQISQDFHPYMVGLVTRPYKKEQSV
jgi:hypothetical protein